MTIFMYIFNGISEFLVLRRVRLLEGAVFSFFFFSYKTASLRVPWVI